MEVLELIGTLVARDSQNANGMDYAIARSVPTQIAGSSAVLYSSVWPFGFRSCKLYSLIGCRLVSTLILQYGEINLRIKEAMRIFKYLYKVLDVLSNTPRNLLTF